MQPSAASPMYTVYAIAAKTGIKYNLTNLITDLDITENDGEIAKRVKITLVNIAYEGSWMNSLISVRDRLYIYASTGNASVEVFRGFIWERPYKSELDKLLTYTAYDHLIYFQESEESAYYASGKSTKDICADLCKNWGVDLSYTYDTITHPKMPLRGNLADIFMEDLLEAVKKQTGNKWVMYSDKDKVYISHVAKNETIYEINARKNALATESQVSMSGMVTKVKITGKADDNDREPVEATVEGDIKSYGTLQKLQSRSEGTTLAEAKKEAQELIDELGKPKKEYSVKATDIPWIRKGDKVKVSAGDMTSHYVVLSISHDCVNKTMTMDLEAAKAQKSTSKDSSGALTAGMKLNLKDCPIYVDAYTSKVANRLTGTYYLYDTEERNGRYRITNTTGNVGKTPIGKYVTGWANKSDIT